MDASEYLFSTDLLDSLIERVQGEMNTMFEERPAGFDTGTDDPSPEDAAAMAAWLDQVESLQDTLRRLVNRRDALLASGFYV